MTGSRHYVHALKHHQTRNGSYAHTALHGGPFKHFVLERGGTTLILRQEKEYCLKYFFQASKHPSFAQLLKSQKSLSMNFWNIREKIHN